MYKVCKIYRGCIYKLICIIVLTSLSLSKPQFSELFLESTESQALPAPKPARAQKLQRVSSTSSNSSEESSDNDVDEPDDAAAAMKEEEDLWGLGDALGVCRL
jgi:hypothetical protein